MENNNQHAKNKFELHVFCLWEFYEWSAKAQSKTIEILESLGKTRLVKAKWSGNSCIANLKRLYKSNIVDKRKLNLIDSNDFAIAIVEEMTTSYSFMQTTTSKKYVNTRVVEAKKLLRTFSSTPFAVHSTDDTYEAEYSMWILFGFKSKNKKIEEFKPDPTTLDQDTGLHVGTHGLDGWKSHEDFYFTLKEFDESIVINKRAASLMLKDPKAYEDYSHDIDLLTKNREVTKMLLCATKMNMSDEQFIIKIGGKIQRIDIHDWKDEYICPALAATAISQRGSCQRGFQFAQIFRQHIIFFCTICMSTKEVKDLSLTKKF